LTIAFVVLCVLGFVGASAFVETVPASKIGVKQQQWGGSGVVGHDFETGFHLGISGIHKWYLLERRTHFLTFADTHGRSSFGQERGSLEMRTSDGNTANVDVTVTYRIKEGEAHLLVAEGLRDVYPDRVFDTVESVLRDKLAMTSEEFYSTEKRLKRSVEALPYLTEALKDLHVVPEALLIRAVRFPAGYEERLQEKQLTYQRKLLATANRKVEEAKQVTGTMEKEIEAAEKERRGIWDKKLQRVRSDNEVAVAEIRGDADKYSKRITSNADADWETMIAEGKLALDTAEALRYELRNKALDTTGGSIYLARKAAENLNIEHVTLNSNDPNVPSVIDLDALVNLLIGDTTAVREASYR
jgi:regulator of protease activity HflC (stomatin/prohibitin superfamily)